MSDWIPEDLLKPLSEEAPCGVDLEAAIEFSSLETLAKGEPERQAGAEIIPAKEPDWKAVRQLCLEMFSRTRDLRVAFFLTHAETALNGIIGLARGTALLRGCLERHWDHVHPVLLQEDGFDPMFRSNVLLQLADPTGIISTIRRSELVAARKVGRFTFRDLDVAEQRAPVRESETAPTLQLLSGALAEAGEDYGRQRLGAIRAVLQDMQAMDSVFRDRASCGGPDLSALEKALRNGAAFFETRLGSTEAAKEGGAGPAGDAAGGAEPVGSNAGQKAAAGGLRTREDAKQRLEEVCLFFERTEPSNPAPILIRRAQRLIDASFMEIMENLAPDSMAELQKLAGPPPVQEGGE